MRCGEEHAGLIWLGETKNMNGLWPGPQLGPSNSEGLAPWYSTTIYRNSPLVVDLQRSDDNTFGELQHLSATRQTDLLSGPLWLLVEKKRIWALWGIDRWRKKKVKTRLSKGRGVYAATVLLQRSYLILELLRLDLHLQIIEDFAKQILVFIHCHCSICQHKRSKFEVT